MVVTAFKHSNYSPEQYLSPGTHLGKQIAPCLSLFFLIFFLSKIVDSKKMFQIAWQNITWWPEACLILAGWPPFLGSRRSAGQWLSLM